MVNNMSNTNAAVTTTNNTNTTTNGTNSNTNVTEAKYIVDYHEPSLSYPAYGLWYPYVREAEDEETKYALPAEEAQTQLFGLLKQYEEESRRW